MRPGKWRSGQSEDELVPLSAVLEDDDVDEDEDEESEEDPDDAVSDARLDELPWSFL